MSGHSKWSTIKRKKGADDAKRGNIFTRLAREIAIAAREGGGDPRRQLRPASGGRQGARQQHAQGEHRAGHQARHRRDKEAAAFEQVTYEGYAPHGVALMIEVITDNRNRTVAEIRHLLSRAGGSMAEAGSVGWQFKRGAYFALSSAGVDPDKIFELAVDAGAEDVSIGEDAIEITAPVEAFKSVSDQAGEGRCQTDRGRAAHESVHHHRAAGRPGAPGDAHHRTLEELDDVQRVYSTLQVTDEAVALLETA